MGLAYKEKEDYTKALEYYEQCLEINTKMKGRDSIHVALAFYNIGALYFNKGEISRAREYKKLSQL